LRLPHPDRLGRIALILVALGALVRILVLVLG
jgi:hypothetical protein